MTILRNYQDQKQDLKFYDAYRTLIYFFFLLGLQYLSKLQKASNHVTLWYKSSDALYHQRQFCQIFPSLQIMKFLLFMAFLAFFMVLSQQQPAAQRSL